MAVIFEAQELVKQFPGVRAVDGVSLAIREGTCFGLLGPNGAGKTTTVEMMEGLIEPTSGKLLYKGAPRGKNFKVEVGIQFQSTSLQDFLTTREVLELFASFYPNPLSTEHLAELCSLEGFLDQDNRNLSGGQRQRLFLALALVSDPQLLFLDEPTTGLDPQARRNFWNLIQNIKAQAKTVVLTTHYMEEAYILCDEIAIMDRGRIIAQGEPEALLRQHFEGIKLEIPDTQFTPEGDFPWRWGRNDGVLEIQTDNLNETIRHLIDRQVSLSGMRVKSHTLEDLFLDLTGERLRN